MKIHKFVQLTVGSAVLAAAASLLLADAAEAGSLMKPSFAAEPMATQMKLKADKTLKRSRLVDVDAAMIAESILPKGLEKAADRAEQSARLAGRVTFELFPDVTVTLSAKHVEDAFSGGVVWRGDINANDYGILVVNNGNITGSIEAGGRSFIIEPTGFWKSPATGAIYPSGWNVKVPKFDLDLTVSPVMNEQELDTRGTTMIVYWEGACEVKGKAGGADVLGRAYVELVGYDRSHDSPNLAYFLMGNQFEFPPKSIFG